MAKTMKLLRRPISASQDSGQILRHQYGISVAESQTFLLAKRHSEAMSEEKRVTLGEPGASRRLRINKRVYY